MSPGATPSAEQKAHDPATNLWPYFSASCYSGFTDPKEGFYAVYASLFVKIAEEEEIPRSAAPALGAQDTSFADVKRFYDYWCNFVSRRTFAFADQWKLNEAPNRQVKRLMEKENQKAREKFRKTRNEQIRVTFSNGRASERAKAQYASNFFNLDLSLSLSLSLSAFGGIRSHIGQTCLRIQTNDSRAGRSSKKARGRTEATTS
jgi:hypothetical protein